MRKMPLLEDIIAPPQYGVYEKHEDGPYEITNGDIVISGTYKNNKKDGVETTATSGKITKIINYSNGKKNGESIEYDDKGNIHKKGQYNNGKRNGDWEIYDKNGNKKIVTYQNNKIIVKNK